eukprot:GHVN01074437.1.p1 GENE.GHVN01074437.1~~GHVN01074437.1.p1  ORF type:complete len:150 (-),score=21.45 GHVN01074437.1:51-500(-)
MSHSRMPYPQRIVEAIGHGFVFGFFSGGGLGLITGFRHSSEQARIKNALFEMRKRAERAAVDGAVLGGVSSLADYGLGTVRRKEDIMGRVLGGAIAGAAVSIDDGLDGVVGGFVNSGASVLGMEALDVFVERAKRTAIAFWKRIFEKTR